MNSDEKFAQALFDGFTNPAVPKRIADLNRPSYEIGDGAEVVLGDRVIIPQAFGGRRAGQWAEVVKLSDDGLGLRFDEKVGGITREFFEWQDLLGTRATAAPRDRKRASVTPPAANSPTI
jgi:hypothetical protein